MAPRAVFLFALLAVSAGASRVVTNHYGEKTSTVSGQRSTADVRQGIDEDTWLKVPRLIAVTSHLFLDVTDALSETEPNFEAALSAVKSQGWELICMLVPTDKQKAEDFKKVQISWDEMFKDLPSLVKEIRDAYEGGDKQAGLEVMVKTVDTALRVMAKADDDAAKDLIALADLVQGLGGAVTKFTKDMDLLGPGESLAQIGGGLQAERFDSVTTNKLMSGGMSLVTAFLTAISEDPPDFDYAILAFQRDGWRMATLLVPKLKEQSDEQMKQAKAAWDHVFNNAGDIVDNALNAYRSKDTLKTVQVVAGTLSTGLTAAAKYDPSDAPKLQAFSDLITGVEESLVKFYDEIGWASEDI